MQLTASRIVAEYRRRTPESEKLAARARDTFPSGITHDARYLEPYPVYIERADGSRKWDVDGNEYVDYLGGHGALLFGHNHPTITGAVSKQLALGTHFGSCHELELRWGELVRQLVPSAKRVRFTNSGTEATLLAFRLARAHTGRSKIIRFVTNFHGWQDHVSFGVASHEDGTPTPGVLEAIAENIILSPPGDLSAVQRLLDQRDDIAAIILEPTGASWGQIPIPESFLHGLYEAARKHEVVLIFDEVISGFRCSPGGAQAYFGITPDMTTLAKILAGGYPGGAVAGRRDIMDWLDHSTSNSAGREKITHHGTFNANPISAAAGIAALEMVAETDACDRANRYAADLRERLRETLRDAHVKWSVYGTFSGFHIFTNSDQEEIAEGDLIAPNFDYRKVKQSSRSELSKKLRLGMLAHGVDIFAWPGGPTSAIHNTDDMERTVEAFRETLRIMKDEGDV